LGNPIEINEVTPADKYSPFNASTKARANIDVTISKTTMHTQPYTMFSVIADDF
jgi:hypothetical protein